MMKTNPILYSVFACSLMLCGCHSDNVAKPFVIEDISTETLLEKMEAKESFTVMIEREGCHFCQAMNEYLEETKNEHPGIQVYHIDTTDLGLYKETDDADTLVSDSKEGQEFLAEFPYFFYTPAVYRIEGGEPVDAGIGYDASHHTLENWTVDAPIDWNAAKPVDVWSFLSQE